MTSHETNLTLSDACAAIRNNHAKIRERTQALQTITKLFEKERVLRTFALEDGGSGAQNANSWLTLFQSLFQGVLLEKPATMKASSVTTAEKRMADIAYLIRSILERAAPLLNKKVTRIILTHLKKDMVHKGRLYSPIALHYIKSIRSLVEYGPHIDHMDHSEWIDLVQLGFNVVLGDPLHQSLENGGLRSPEPSEETDDGLFAKDDDTEDAVVPGKRRRAATPQASTSATNVASPRKKRRKVSPPPVTLEQVEFQSVLVMLMQSSASPLLSEDCPNLSSSILLRFQRFLETYPPESSLYNDFLPSLLSTLSHLSLNRRYDMVKFARHSWNDLVGLLGKKTALLNEGVVAILHLLLPYVIAHSDSPQIDLSMNNDWFAGVSKLWKSLLQWDSLQKQGTKSIPYLPLEALRLELHGSEHADPHSESKVFMARTFRAGWNFDANHALMWAVLQLQADCTEIVSSSPHR